MTKDLLWRIGDEYRGAPLDPEDCDPDPLVELGRWMKLAVDAELATPNAMTLATVDERGRPAARVVLLKQIDARGLVFFTNYESRKARDLAAHGFAAVCLYWEPLHRQVRVEGTVERIAAEESDAYFATRPRGSQLGAIASPQSQPIADRKTLEDRLAQIAATYDGATLPRPAHWGGYRVVPDTFEFWQGQPSRLHDRVRYRKAGDSWLRD